MEDRDPITEIELEKLGFKSVGISGCVFSLVNIEHTFVVQFYEYYFELEIDHNSRWIELWYVSQLQKLL